MVFVFLFLTYELILNLEESQVQAPYSRNKSYFLWWNELWVPILYSPVLEFYITCLPWPQGEAGWNLGSAKTFALARGMLTEAEICMDCLFLPSSSKLSLEEHPPGSGWLFSLDSRRKPRNGIQTEPMAMSQAQLASSLKLAVPSLSLLKSSWSLDPQAWE